MTIKTTITDAELEKMDRTLYRLFRRWIWRQQHGLVPSKTVDVVALLKDYEERRDLQGNSQRKV